jgi:hypothetical protein
MADINLAGFNVDPKTIAGFRKLGFDKGFKTPFAASFLDKPAVTAAENDPYAPIEASIQQQQKPFDVSKLNPYAQETYAMMQGFQFNPLQAIVTARIQDIQSRQANQMGKENLRLAEEAAVRKQGREFTLGQMGRLFESIPRAFSPIPFERTQEVAANIANLVSPRNLSPQAQLQQAQYSVPVRQYFG